MELPFNTDTCQNCHIKNGRGYLPCTTVGPVGSMLLRHATTLAVGSKPTKPAGEVPQSFRGDQSQDTHFPGNHAEGRVRLKYTEIPVTFSDHSQINVRKPGLNIELLGYSPMHTDMRFSTRIAPSMIGVELLEAISEHDIRANAVKQSSTSRLIHDKVNEVWDQTKGKVLIGRFGWKADQPDLNQKNTHVFTEEMGRTNTLSTRNDCTQQQTVCREAPRSGTLQVSEQILANLLYYTRNLAVPRRRDVDSPQVLIGKALFHQAGCASCHVPSYVTGDASEPRLSRQKIFPYTDLLLHNMGDELADGRSEYLADGNHWRTPPLWGIGQASQVSGPTHLLHDGRARTLMEAIVWHGGEARGSRNEVLMFDQAQRDALVRFLNSL
ncbi:MAG: di-heme oxidoredictase family protein [Pseudomonas gingeri]